VRVCLLDPSGRVLKHLKPRNADDLVSRGVAERRSESVIVLKSGSAQRTSIWPNYDEVRADTAHWAGVTETGPRLSEEKRDFLRGMKRLSA
jgi:hypothetical protein